MSWKFLILLCFVLLPTAVQAQRIDPYRRLNDPLAICDLSGCDTAEARGYVNVVGSSNRDTNGYFALAGDDGSGIIRHFWDTYDWGHAAPTDSLKLVVDDSVVAFDQAESFFHLQSQWSRSPFDTAISGGQVCQSQIPYKHNFRFLFNGGYAFRAASWQPLPYDSVPDPFGSDSTFVNQSRQKAEDNYWKFNPWTSETGHTDVSEVLQPEEQLILTQQQGPGIIQSILILPETFDSSLLRNVYLIMKWDERQNPSVEVPVADFFGIASGMREIRSIRIRASATTGLECTFPMPFRRQAIIYLENRGPKPIAIRSRITFTAKPIPDSYGYFCAQFHNSPLIRRKTLQSVVHVKGRGRFVGDFLMMPLHPRPMFLEGDPVLMVDSNQSETLHYIGSEDYFNAGWYFLDSAFSLPLCGCPDRWGCMYRFHINDALNFSKSFDFRFGHGAKDDDFRTAYRTVGFYYSEIIPFWTSSDTIASGKSLMVSGMSYRPNQSIGITLNGTSVDQLHADEHGAFSVKLDQNLLPVAGSYQLAVNGVLKFASVVILPHSTILYTQDSANQVAVWRDSIEVQGYGFENDERLDIYIGDTTLLTHGIQTDSNGYFHTTIYIPRMDSGSFRFYAHREDGSRIATDSSIAISRMMDYEIEDLNMIEGVGYYNYAGFTAPDFGNQEFTFIYADPGDRFTWEFTIPYADTFDLNLFATIGDRWGQYRVLIDNIDCGVSDWFVDWPWGPVGRSGYDLGNHALQVGTHFLTCICLGKDSAAIESSFGPDALTATPIGPLPSITVPIRSTPQSTTQIYPNPMNGQTIYLLPGKRFGDSPTAFTVTLFDLIGRSIAMVYTGPADIDGKLSLHLPELASGSYILEIEDGTHTPDFVPFIHFK